jgi:putative sigma-54 modulation protein
MKANYTGKLEKFYPAQQDKLDARFKKLGKLLDGRGEKFAHVILAKKRGVHSAEITVNYMDKGVVATADDPDQYTAITSAIDRLEKQVLKIRNKRRDGKKNISLRTLNQEPIAPLIPVEVEPAPERRNGRPRVYRVMVDDGLKPMTLEEAILEMGERGGYLVYRDSNSNTVSVLLRRADGHLDLVESH